jgi:hypothetical protein
MSGMEARTADYCCILLKRLRNAFHCPNVSYVGGWTRRGCREDSQGMVLNPVDAQSGAAWGSPSVPANPRPPRAVTLAHVAPSWAG